MKAEEKRFCCWLAMEYRGLPPANFWGHARYGADCQLRLRHHGIAGLWLELTIT